MTKRSPSPRLLAFLLCLPLVVLAGTGVWALVSESARVEAEVRKEARERARETAEFLNGAEAARRVAALEVFVPEWQFNGGDPPPAGPLAEDYSLVLASQQTIGPASVPDSSNGSPDPVEQARKRLQEAIHSGEILAAASPAGLPLWPLVAQVVHEGEESAPAICTAALRQPNELTGRLVSSVVESLPPDSRLTVSRRAGRAMELAVSLKQRRGEDRTLPDWLGDWHIDSASRGVVRMVHLEDIRQLMGASPGVSAVAPFHWKPDISPGMTTAVSWHGKPVMESPGEDLAIEQSGPWRVAVMLASRLALQAESLRRLQSLAWVLLGAIVVTAFSLWMAHRAFKKQLALTNLQSEFVASVSHELRTPVASIGVLAERLEEGRADPAQAAQYHRFIAREGKRLAGLVNNVLDFSRIERGAKQYDFEHTDLPSLVHETATLLRPAAEEKGLTLTEELREVPEDQWPEVDAVAIRQALVNLLENAIKFTPAGGKVTVVFANSPAGVILRVRDTGIGIPRGEHKRIFERFFRVDNGLRRETNGAGIGLSLVWHIAKSHRAKVTVESEVGKFSVFTIQFPKVQPNGRRQRKSAT